MKDSSTVCWDPINGIVTMRDKHGSITGTFQMPRSLDNLEERVDLPSGYLYSFRIRKGGKLKISAPLRELGVIWSVQCQPL
jgi:hypothetical protein